MGRGGGEGVERWEGLLYRGDAVLDRAVGQRQMTSLDVFEDGYGGRQLKEQRQVEKKEKEKKEEEEVSIQKYKDW